MESFNVIVKLTQFFLWCLKVSQKKAGQGYQCHSAPHWEKGSERDICCCQPNYLFPTYLLQLCRGPVNSSYTEVKKKGYITDCFVDERGWPNVRDGSRWAQVNVLSLEKLGPKCIGMLFPSGICHIWQCMITQSYCLIQPVTTTKSIDGWLSVVNLLSLWRPSLCVRFKSQCTYEPAYLSEAESGSSLWR